MTHDTSAERGLRISKVRLIRDSGEFDEFDFASGMINILHGVRNSSKSTTLRVIDYCLGDRDSAAKAIGVAVADAYEAVTTDLRIHGQPYELTRSWSYGRMGKISINGEDLAAADFSDWILAALEWPNVHIPLGLNPSTATELTPLSFRSTLRHIHRNESSWISFAHKEQEFIRRAVISQLLGFARPRATEAQSQFSLAQAKRRLNEAEAVDREVQQSTVQAVTAICENMNLPLARSTAHVADARREVEAALGEVRRRQQELTEQVRITTSGATESEAPAGYDPSLTALYSQVTRELRQATVTALEHLREEHTRSASTVSGEIGRMERLITSVGIFDALPVRLCPACEQNIDPARHHADTACYVCYQNVDDDHRQRRAQVEIRSLKSELEDLDEVVSRTLTDLTAARELQAHLQAKQVALATRLNAERAAQLAPFVAALEELAGQAARLEHKLTAFPAIEAIFQRRDQAREALESAQRAVSELDTDAATPLTIGAKPADRCAAFAERMNLFLEEFRGDPWVDRDVSIRDRDLTFYVGTRPWDDALGAEAKVLFFLAYSYATLFLQHDLDDECAFPGLLLLDNPYQQGIEEDVVRRVLHKLAQAASETGTQIISTQAPKPPAGSKTIRVIPMPRVYAAP
ncbi:hypothetical protein GCM10018980_76370 [Streptomyces capoamus]|uniref:Rad50/SbcC-type AAA domain-containing protein n=1 Tax=Streptomyces capoamus TaxID=68183 RepID=A0A919F461_9ACTN|nr:hypothetical protein [Streptomyces capoamus]GGW13075.1 hypothetical protein GCM10010501_15160 [Streptomyces libani subsp. rufus]GHG77805.1 hypothetical protein GCM10018980_76370 [Streptomyces capoamus]